ncbi:MAG: TldD/PmbA family protein [Bdellovibrionales bacterium]|nr:TldD/PmbA family protein [Bdellovibrionales bacterium]
MPFQRAPFDPKLNPLRQTLLELIPILEAKPEWYGSAYFEKKSSQLFNANLRQTNLKEDRTQGVVLRIYDGYTLHEQATDDLEVDALKRLAREFAARVEKLFQAAAAQGLPKRPYTPPTWAERLKENLETEITSQIPKDVDAKTPVHFGIRFEKDPLKATPDVVFAKLKGLVSRQMELAKTVGLKESDLHYLMSRQTTAVEESIFVDRQSNLSQTLYRVMLGLAAMSGADRSTRRIGGLGGEEAIEIPDSEITEMLADLKGIKEAQRMTPGRYRVIFSPSLSGVLAHEAFGHSQEADTCARGRSKAWDLHLDGTSVGNEHATILNNPAIFDNGPDAYAAWGSYFFDEEGWLAKEQVLLDRGTLKAPMTNLTSAIRLNIPRTANGKRESFAHGVYTRQTNTYFSAGKSTLDQLIAELGDGFIATEAAGGMEDPKGMGIQVGIQFLKEVRGGKLTGKYFKGPAGGDIQLTGYTPDVLNSIVGKTKIEFLKSEKDRAKHPVNDVGGCGKYHKEFVNAGCGGPYLLMKDVILG